ncbi:MAG: hypothetical protein H8D80_01875 [Proteobacteria bacterium]|nr:hypothetical protein [Pseudomonadota bacterium]
MAQPTSRATLKEFALRRLGAPVIEINVDDSQLEDRIDDALQFFAEYHFDGVERTYLKLQITQDDIDNEYFTISENIISITKIFQLSEGTVNLFDVRYQMALNDFYGLRNPNMSMVQYDITKRHLSMIQDILSPEKSIRFSRVTNQLKIDTDWSEEFSVGDYIIAEGYLILDPETYTEIYKDRMLKNYVTALFKKQWGSNLSKFDGIQLPGGVQFNGREIMEQAQTEIEKIEENVQLMYELPPDFIVG